MTVILPVPHLLQQQRGECLAACAMMSLVYQGVIANYHHIVKLLEIKPGIGAPAYNIHKLTRLGLHVIYKQGTLIELHHHIQNNIPCITFVKTAELPYWTEATDHAILVVGLDEKYIYLNDPAFDVAPVRVSVGDFDLAWLERDEYYAVVKQKRGKDEYGG